MGGTCSMHEGVKNYLNFWLENCGEDNHFQDVGTNGRKVLKWNLKLD